MRDNAVTPNSSPSSMTTTVVPAFVHAPRLTLKLGNVLPVAVLSLCYDSNLNCSQREHSVRALISALFRFVSILSRTISRRSVRLPFADADE